MSSQTSRKDRQVIIKIFKPKNVKFKQDLDAFPSGQVREAETYTYLGPGKET